MQHIKYIAYIVVALVILIVVWEFSSLLRNRDTEESSRFLPQPDSSFVPISTREYRPPSTPFERKSKPPVRLPAGRKETDVGRVVRIIKEFPVDALRTIVDTTDVIQMTSGEIFVPKQEGTITQVEEIRYTDPIMAFGAFYGVGISAGGAKKFYVSPGVFIAPIEFYGKVQCPIVTLDSDGIGAGVGVRYERFVIGALSHWRFDNALRGGKVSLHYSIK